MGLTAAFPLSGLVWFGFNFLQRIVTGYRLQLQHQLQLLWRNCERETYLSPALVSKSLALQTRHLPPKATCTKDRTQPSLEGCEKRKVPRS